MVQVPGGGEFETLIEETVFQMGQKEERGMLPSAPWWS